MCTLTLIPRSAARAEFRLAFNRDELRARPAALPPEIRNFGDNRAILPIDSRAGGTWTAASDAGLVFALLNVNLPSGTLTRSATKPTSRGTIIPRLLAAKTLSQASELARAIDVREFDPFRLIVCDRAAVAELRSDGRGLDLRFHSCRNEPLLFTSSGLGDELVEGPRRSLFSKMFRNRENWPAAQAAFHRHHWPDRPEISVNMSRRDARTVSFTVIELRPESATLSYLPDAPDRPAVATQLQLDVKDKASI